MKNGSLDFLKSEPSLIFEIRQGIEREALRVNNSGEVSLKNHPSRLGHKLTHKHITTDYSENLLEFITDVHRSRNDALQSLSEIQAFTYKALKENQEFLWPISMPGILPDDENKIPLADYGESHVGKLKTLYRKGLGFRYGRSMQSIAGIHFNFSLTDTFWLTFKEYEKSEETLQEYKNEKYFHLIRNFQRYKWVLMYFFGASNIVHESFLTGKKHNLEKLSNNSYYDPNALSLRMGGLGYTSSAQENINICFNKVETYISTLENARLESYPDYEKIGLKKDDEYLQLNTHLLQIDNEFYSTIRPKNIAKSKESALKALNLRGIEYIEVRLCDVDPFSATGISSNQAGFMHLFLLWCLFKESDTLSENECRANEDNFHKVVTQGISEKISLINMGQKIEMNEWLKNIFSELSELEKVISPIDPSYALCLDEYTRVIENPDLLKAKQYLHGIRTKSFESYHYDLAMQHEQGLTLSEEKVLEFEKCSRDSELREREIVENDKGSFSEFLDKYFQDIKING